MGAQPEVGMSFAHANDRDPTETEVPALMKVLIGVDPHKGSVAVAVVDKATGELIERTTSFPQNRAGLRALEDAGRHGSPSVVGPSRTLAASG